MIEIPADYRARVMQFVGEPAAEWLAALPDVIADLCWRWQLIPDGPVRHSTLGLVVPVLADGEPAALKVGWQNEATRTEARALDHWRGRGTVLLLANEPGSGAMLLERLDPDRTLADVPIFDAASVAGHLIRQMAVPPVPGIETLAEHARRIADSLPGRWLDLGRPMSRRWLEDAIDLARELPHTPAGPPRMVNHDLWDGNILAGQRQPWLAIDPMAVSGAPEFGIGQLLWRRVDDMTGPSDLDRFIAIVTDVAGLDGGLVRHWCVVRIVDYWLWGLSVGLTNDPRRCERLLEWLGHDPAH